MSYRTNSAQKKILIVNGYDSEWLLIPMGTFGLCDYLHQHGIKAKIFNAALYDKSEYLQRLRKIIENYKPDYIGLILHWKELFENHILLSTTIKELFPDISIISGGMTAGFLNKELLSRFESIDFVIKGDPEEPLRLLMTQKDRSKIPNLAYRTRKAIKINDCKYVADSKTLNAISYAKLQYLIDKERYINKIDTAGFPIFIGRGCVFDCFFCGGSKKAFRVHSNRKNIVYRSINSVINDLKRLLKYTDSIYLCYDWDIQYIYDLFTAILSERQLVKKFRLNYGGWHLVDSKLIELYVKAFKVSANTKSIIEISPETSIERDRKIIRDKALFFSNKQMFQAVNEISEKLGDFVRIHIFYSRYHVTHTNKQKLMKEWKNIHSFLEYAYINEKCKIHINYGHLATDVGSLYWDIAFKMIGKNSAIDLLLEYIKKRDLRNADDFKRSDLCIFTPKLLDKTVQFKYEQLILWSYILLETVPAYYFNLTKVLGFGRSMTLLKDLINKYVSTEKWYFFRDVKTPLLVDMINNKIKKKYQYIYKRNSALFNGLFILFERYLNTPYDKKDKYHSCYVKRPVLDKAKICITHYDYISKSFYRLLNGNIEKLCRRKVLNVFCGKEIHNFDYKYYHVFKLFDGKNTWEGILKKIQRSNLFTKEELVSLYRFLLEYRYYFII